MAGAIDTTLSGITDLTSTMAAPSAAGDKAGKKETAAAQDFEALLIGQMLRSMREEGSGWLGTGDDAAGATAFAFGEGELAKALTKGGGLGLSKIIAAGLATKAAQAERNSSPDVSSSNRPQ
jgi:Rod binding domain-containing protein